MCAVCVCVLRCVAMAEAAGSFDQRLQEVLAKRSFATLAEHLHQRELQVWGGTRRAAIWRVPVHVLFYLTVYCVWYVCVVCACTCTYVHSARVSLWAAQDAGALQSDSEELFVLQLLCLLHLGQTSNARFLWKRLPPPLKKSKELAAAWAVRALTHA